MKPWVCLLVLSAALCHCAAFRPPATAPQSVISLPPVAPRQVVARIDQTDIALQDLPADTLRQLQDLQDDMAQRRFTLLWTGIEEAIASRVLAQEASRQHVTIAALLMREVDQEVGNPSDAELQDLYNANQGLLDMPFVRAREHLLSHWRNDRKAALRRSLIDRLLQKSPLEVSLPPPQLSRHLPPKRPSPTRGKGKNDAPVSIVSYGDYACPYSAQGRRALEALAGMYKEHVRLEYRDFVLPQHGAARAAAHAAHCAAEQARFWPYQELLFGSGATLSPEALGQMARRAELDTTRFEQCMASPRPAQALERDAQDAQALGVQGTPTLFINGMRVRGTLPLPLLQTIVDAELVRLGVHGSEA